jgi:hypothetical protein
MNVYNDYNHTGYNRTMWEHMGNGFERQADIPNPNLAVGDADKTNSLPILITRYDTPVQTRVVLNDMRAYGDQVLHGEKVAPLKADMFPMSGYMGEALGGF